MTFQAPPPVLPEQVEPPAYTLSETPFDDLSAGADGACAVAVPVLSGDHGSPLLGPGAVRLSEDLGLDLVELLERFGATGKAGEVHEHVLLGHPRWSRLVLVGVGQGSAAEVRRAGAHLGRAVRDEQLLVSTVASVGGVDALAAFVTGLTLGSFAFHWRKDGAQAQPVRNVVVAGSAQLQPDLDRAVAIANASWTARLLATVPSNLKNPAWLADQAQQLASGSGLKVSVRDEAQLRAEGFGGILAVGAASATPPRLIRIDYTPSRKVARGKGHIALVGKGITFDTGGLSIKPGESMSTMKRDMTGGAVVIATMAALAAVECPVRVTAFVAAAENAISGSSYRPGDVITHYGGRTTEVTNTDAEGRLVMADALALAVEKVKPDALVDVATLTGAMKVALGLRTGGYFANHEALATLIDAASAASGERLWRMPLADDYEARVESKVADGDNGAGSPGAITAALFLQHFTGDVPWLHLDVASVGDAPQDDDEWTAGPTGFGARLLLEWLGSANPLAGVGKRS
ncbi:leucyl aminopeptidase family protein [Nocardioides sp. AE5]|uniref:leucyl aminopeptidase family protein n=1 Tax=Nocardioides sp. AE5 TaxID=2962573 RepID=UPI00288238C1|nr:leucyl aminopeptidase family protein [Nocardioides sp. AE5]MDT0202111.1 leucyl aminopeptidase family protein [Nocardioides sp. AE5]